MIQHMKDTQVLALVNKFKDYLLSSPFKDKIVKIILFGSHAKGTAIPDSDIDIMIFTSNGKEIEKDIMDRAFEFMMDHHAPLEILTSHIDDLFISHDFFIYNIIHNGMEVYSMKEEDIKRIMVQDMLNLSVEYLDSARDVLKMNRIRLAIDAAYNAAELATKALILLKSKDLPGSHGGVVSFFGQLYIKTKEVDPEIGRNLNMALKLRNEARYKPNSVLTRENAEFIINLSERLIQLLQER